MTSAEFIERELLKRNLPEHEIRDYLEIFKKAIGIENNKGANRLYIDSERHEIFIDGVLQRDIPKKVFKLIELFEKNKGILLTRDRLLESVWPDVCVWERTVDVHIRKLRIILGNDAIETIKGIGYKFKGI